MDIDVVPATADRFDDVAVLLAPRDPDAPSCWCLSMRLPNAENHALPARERPARLRRYAEEGLAPGVLAYVDGAPAGWCSVAPRASYHRLTHSRTIPTVDEVPVWSIVCFVVRPAFRRRGVTRALLRGAVEFAFANGAPAVEAYPVDTQGERIDGTLAYVGVASLFESEGFHHVQDTKATSARRPRVLMRRMPS
jgi:GNAT superfamily N-acetyltransferase